MSSDSGRPVALAAEAGRSQRVSRTPMMMPATRQRIGAIIQKGYSGIEKGYRGAGERRRLEGVESVGGSGEWVGIARHELDGSGSVCLPICGIALHCFRR